MRMLDEPVRDLPAALADVLDHVVVGQIPGCANFAYLVLAGEEILSAHQTLDEARVARAEEVMVRLEDLRSRTVLPLFRVGG